MGLKTVLTLSLFLLVCEPLAGPSFLLAEPQRGGRDRDAQRQQEEQEDYFRKWLTEDVVYIISPEEKSVFQRLTTIEEKEQFIEQFWYRRDPDPRTAANEFKEEHYRRIAFANERYASGIPGWMTDRGRVYIIHGPPAEIDSRPSGGAYQRPMHEGGGTTSTFPFEVWRYRHIEGIGSDVEIEFVDPTFSGEYRIARTPEEKDALLHVPGAGLTLAEEMGLAEKADRPYFSPGMRDYPMMHLRAKDNPFERYETIVRIQRPVELKYPDLKQIVDINITYNNLPFGIRQDYFKLNDHQLLVPITLEFENRNLTFKEEYGVHTAKMAIYGIVTSITNRIITEFEDDVTTSYQPQFLQQGLQGRSVYQKILPLDRTMRYKLDLVVKDLNSGHVGVIRQAIIPPGYDEEKLVGSSLILSDHILQMDQVPREDEMFVLGDIKIRPNLSKSFDPRKPLGVYFQVYNAGIDQTTLSPSLGVTFTISKGGTTLLELNDQSGESIQFFSGQRVVVIRVLPLQDLEPGEYRLEVKARDLITDQEITLADSFSVVEPPAPRMASN